MDSGLGTEARARVEQSGMPDGVANRHVSPVQPDSGVIADLESQLKVALESQQVLRNELNSLRENQLAMVDQERREVAASYEVQIGSLQQSLMQAESTLQNVEKQLTEAQEKHGTEMENLLKREEVLLQERDQKHADHVTRLTAKLTRQQEVGGAVGTLGDADEQEAERLRMIKEKMRELHEREKAKMAEEHQQEAQKIRGECQQQMEVYRQQMEQLANGKIQEMHAQFMSAHQAVLGQKNSAEADVEQWREEVERTRSQLDAVLREKTGVEEKYQAVLRSHSAEIEMIRRNSHDLEKRLENWKGKAANLETRLERSGVEKASDLDHLHRQNEEAVQKIRLECEEKLQAQQLLAEDYQNQLEALHRQHEVELESVKATHVSEVSLMEESISDATTSRASLEIAEEHMRSLQTQLEAYRMQESSFQGRLSELKRQHAEDIELLRQQFENQKAEEIEEVSAKFAAQMESLDEEMASLQQLVEAEHEDKEVLEALKAKHQRELLQVQATLHDRHELALQALRKEIELSHSRTVDALKRQHSGQVDVLRAELEKEWAVRVKAAREDVATELEMARDAEINRLQTEHQLALKQLRQSLDEADGDTEAGSRIASLEAELQTARVQQTELVAARQDLLSQLELAQRRLQESSANLGQVNSEKAQLSETCQKYQNELKSLEVDLNIARSAGEQDKQVLEQTQEALVQWRARAEQLQQEVSELDTAEKSKARLSQQKVLELLDEVAVKNIEVASLQAENDSLSTEVSSLTQKCQQQVALSESLQKQLEGSTTASSKEVVSLQQQVTELLPAREECGRLQDRTSELEDSLHGKDSEIMSLRSHLDQANKQLMELESHWSVKYEESVATSAGELEALRQEIAAQETELKQEVEQYKRQLDEVTADNEQAVAGLSRTVEELQGRLDSSGEESTRLQEEKSELERELKDLQRTVDELAGDDDDQESEVVKRLQQDFEAVQTEKDRLAHELAELQEERKLATESHKASEDRLLEQERTIRDLQSQLSARELAFSEIQDEFGRQLTQSETRESSLRQRMQDSRAAQEQLGAVMGEKSALEDNLSRARHSLTEKLQEKMGLERELSYHRTELERRLAEKQRMEELLFEKSRFEQELLSQKDELQQELSEIEVKLKLKDVEMEQERSEWLVRAQEKDSAIRTREEEAKTKDVQYREKEQQLHQEHVGELGRLRGDLTLKHSADLSTLTDELNSRHEKQVSTFREDHRRQLGEAEASLRQKHDEAVCTLQTKQKKEVI